MTTTLIVILVGLVVAAPALLGWMAMKYEDRVYKSASFRNRPKRYRSGGHHDSSKGGAGTFGSWDGAE